MYEMSRIYSTNGKREIHIMSLLENIKEKDFLGDIGVNGTTI
jgi:hypothetical protein